MYGLARNLDELFNERGVGKPIDPFVHHVHRLGNVAFLDMATRVILESRLLVECLATVALKGLLAIVSPHVAVELGLAKKP
eukprot:m.375520 g.375520  ORF g.375520 m.375520 type:complete len:81 (-) comp16698_c4_seq1:1036-1278(-)